MIESVAQSTSVPVGASERVLTPAARFARQAVAFVVLGIVLYIGLYFVAEQIVNAHTLRNRFFVVKTAPLERYDTVILGASHAAVFDYQDMNARLELLTGTHVMNLSVVGGGITVNRLLMDYALSKHDVGSVVYFLDSFAFYSAQWNEQRLSDTHLYDRAPFDINLAALLLKTPATQAEASDYLSGFSKINNQDRFTSDISDDEALRFTTTYRPVTQIDNQRLRYLYPSGADDAAMSRYLAQFEDLLNVLVSRGVNVKVIKPPLPSRVYQALPAESAFDARIGPILEGHGVAFFDFSQACNNERFFFNTDHLNREGVLNFYNACLVGALSTAAR